MNEPPHRDLDPHSREPDIRHLDTLARDMVRRHLQVCLPRDVRETLSIPPILQATGDHSRIIAVVGAGASAQVLEPGAQIRDRLRTELGRFDSGYDAEIRRLEQVYEFNREDLETVLFALSRTPEGELRVRERLSQIYRVRHPAVLTHELLAHLLKHRFIDAIVNFNFDEILDQALDIEIGSQEYVRVVSERDCEGRIFDPDASNYLPVHLKLHGTASDPESLRFTRESYHALPARLEDVVRQLIGQEVCVVINLGFRMRSFDFTQLLNRPARLEVYNLSLDPLTDPACGELEQAQRPNRTPDIRELASLPDSDFSSEPPPVNSYSDRLVRALTTRIEQQCRTAQSIGTFRSVSRHRLVCGLMNWDADLSDKALLSTYLADRTILEMAFSAIRGAGLVSIASLVRDRCAKYFQLSEPEWRRRGERWLAVCRKGGLQPSRISAETFVSLPNIRTHDLVDGDEAQLDDLGIDLTKLLDHLIGELSERTRRNIGAYGYDRVLKELIVLQEGEEIEVQSRADSICSRIFLNAVPLPSLAALRGHRLHLLQNYDFDQLVAVTETGGWLLEEPYVSILRDRPNLKMLLVVAFNTNADELESKFQGRVCVQQMHWWRHNRHMTLICNRDRPVAGVYFARRQRSLFVTPVFLEHQKDVESLMRSFVTYWKRTALTPRALEWRDVRDATFTDVWKRATVRNHESRIDLIFDGEASVEDLAKLEAAAREWRTIFGALSTVLRTALPRILWAGRGSVIITIAASRALVETLVELMRDIHRLWGERTRAFSENLETEERRLRVDALRSGDADAREVSLRLFEERADAALKSGFTAVATKLAASTGYRGQDRDARSAEVTDAMGALLDFVRKDGRIEFRYHARRFDRGVDRDLNRKFEAIRKDDKEFNDRKVQFLLNKR